MTLLDEALAAHGGIERWRAAREVRAELRTGGVAYPMRLRRAPLHLRISADPREPRSAIDGIGDRRGHFSRDRVAFEGGPARDDPRAAFRAFSRRAIRWDDLDLLYFAGYASWHYLTAPFHLAREDVDVRELPGRRLAATYPPRFPAHSRTHVFHLDAAGRVVRLDYTAEVFGSWARAAHVCAEHRDFGGILAPTRRRVTPVLRGRVLPGPTLIWIELLDLRVA